MNPRLEGVTIRGIEIRMMDELSDFIKENNIEIAVLTISKDKSNLKLQTCLWKAVSKLFGTLRIQI